MNAQLSLTYRPSHAGGEAWQRQLAVLRTIVEHLGRKDVAFEIDVSGSALSDALSERDRKRWAAEWTQVVKAMLVCRHDDTSFNLLRELADCDMAVTPFVVEQSVELTPEEIATAYERELKALGAIGKAAIDRVRGKGKR